MRWYFILLSIVLFIILLITIINSLNNKKENYIINNQIIHTYIFQTVRSKNDINDDIRKNIDYLCHINYDYEYYLYEDNDCIDFIKNNYGKEILDVYLSINPSYGPAKADLFRYLLMYKYGGVYLDIKSSCNIPFSRLINDNDKYILSHWSDTAHNSNKEFQQWHIICVPNHPFLKKVITEVINNIKNYNIIVDGTGKNMVLNLTGPIAYTKAITSLLDKYKYTLYKSHKKIKLVYQSFNHLKYFGKKHYKYCTESLIKN